MTTQRKSTREFAQAIVDSNVPIGVPVTAIWGVVQSGPDATTPPTLTATLGADLTPVSNIAFLDSYQPAAGDKIFVLEMGSDRLVIGAQAT